MSKFRYTLTPNQYDRFQHPTNTQELNTLGKLVDTKVVRICKDSWEFAGAFYGTGRVYTTEVLNAKNYTLVIQVDKKPWFIPDFLIDYFFRKSLV